MRIDLHTHSSASDGTDSPAELMQIAHAAGLDVVALTDHDTTAGWAEAAAARPAGLTLVRGTEFSCVHWEGDRPVGLHLLAYLFDPEAEPLRAERAELRRSREDRARRIVERMVGGGLPISWDQVADIADGSPVGRPHIGRALVASGYVPDVPTAFEHVLTSKAGYYLPKQDLDALRAVELIRAAGGVSVFAHSQARRRGPTVSDRTVARFAAAGLDGIEVDHPDHDATDRAHAARLAAELDLVATGASDYHGTNKTTRIGEQTTTADNLAALLARRPTALAPLG